jgi:hypothetical protein
MNYRLRYKDVKSACAGAAGMCETDPRLLAITNEAVETLVYKGRWVGLQKTFRFCVPSSNNCITWPREIETPEAVALCKSPVTIRSGWYEFSENGYGELDSDDTLCKTMIDRGEACAFDEVVGSNKKLAVYADRSGNTGKYINLQFWDENGQWVQSTFNGQLIDGEQIAIPSAGSYNYTNATVKPGGLLAVKKDITQGIIRLFEYDTVTTALRPLAYYQGDEEVPLYRRSLLPSLADGSCEQRQVTVRAKLRFIPMRNDESWCQIPNLRALRLAVKAVKKERDEIYDEANVNWAMAYTALAEQVQHHLGSGEKNVPQFETAATWGGGIPSIL